MKRLSLFFTRPMQICLEQETLPQPMEDELLVRAVVSAISAGTEMLFYRGEFPVETTIDTSIPALQGQAAYPLKYGYCMVGEVTGAGPDADPAWLGKLVFSFHPHESAFLAKPAELIPVPEGLQPEQAVLLPNMETAVNLVMDGSPMIGEQVAVFGQGVVGLFTTSLLKRFPLGELVAFDQFPLRRRASLAFGAQACLDPFSDCSKEELANLLPDGADLVYELSGSPAAINQAIAACRYSGRVVIGSWYGQKQAPIALGGHFHRSRIRLISSQVSTVAPELAGRWSKERRFNTAWQMLRQLDPSAIITHRIPFERAGEAYRLLDKNPQEAIQVVFTYQT